MTKVFARNKRAPYLYEITETWEAGLSLEGWEARSTREGRMSINLAHARIRDGEVWLVGAHIAPLPHSSARQDATRDRRLLLHGREIRDLERKTEPKGMALVPLRAYGKRGVIKIKLALGKGRGKADKRDRILEKIDRADAKDAANRAMGRG
ncbi:SsrA-binding protein SmpB [bacterium]|nr:SsrA-binding protein SmpB [bacterium]